MKGGRIYILTGFIFVIAGIFVARLFYLQIMNDTYKERAKRNKSVVHVKYPYRGVIYDRNKRPLVVNEPAFDLMITWKEVELKDTARFCDLLNIDRTEFQERMEKLRGSSDFLLRRLRPQVFLSRITNEHFASIQDVFHFKGFNFHARTQRTYPHKSLANVLGYTAEISSRELKKDSMDYYSQGDFVGKSGIEATYERFLRGEKGMEFVKVNAKGIEIGPYEEGRFDTAAVPGENLTCTIDLALQQYGEKLMQNKIGSIVAIEPSTGEILALVSSPSYDPNLLAGSQFSKNYRTLEQDKKLTPLFNRGIQAKYPPGSTFKIIQSLISMQLKVVKPNEQVFTGGDMLGDHAPAGYYDTRKAIMLSSNRYYWKVMKRVVEGNRSRNKFEDARLGLDVWHKHITSFGLGEKLGVDIFNEEEGLVPDSKYYDRRYKKHGWRYSTIYSLSIGQGELQITPLQLANLGAIIANRGYFYTPHFIRGMHDWEKRYTTVDSSYFKYVIEGMQDVVNLGTARRAIIPDIQVCGKTGTVENKVGDRTIAKDHSVFMAFAPKENPKIAIAVYVENSGNYGGTWAAPISALMIEKYIKGEISNTYKEKRILEADFITPEEERTPATPTVAVPRAPQPTVQAEPIQENVAPPAMSNDSTTSP